MADITDTKTPYEVLIRYGDHGRPVGAHVQYLRTVTLDGELLKADVLPPVELAIDGNFPTNEIMSDAARTALEQVGISEAARVAAVEELAAAKERIATMEGTNFDLGEKLKIGILENAGLISERDNLKEELKKLNAEIESTKNKTDDTSVPPAEQNESGSQP